jgi:hypothetical protein
MLGNLRMSDWIVAICEGRITGEPTQRESMAA